MDQFIFQPGGGADAAYGVIGAEGNDRVAHTTLAALDPSGRPVVGTERSFAIDAVCDAGPQLGVARLASIASRHASSTRPT